MNPDVKQSNQIPLVRGVIHNIYQQYVLKSKFNMISRPTLWSILFHHHRKIHHIYYTHMQSKQLRYFRVKALIQLFLFIIIIDHKCISTNNFGVKILAKDLENSQNQHQKHIIALSKYFSFYERFKFLVLILLFCCNWN